MEGKVFVDRTGWRTGLMRVVSAALALGLVVVTALAATTVLGQL
ncbi:hypothetical protein [Actinosynnema mirum]|nr:hypothetical protein [Actinosynnema mirum]AXX28625.1 hypothetical protein APASM_1260 [Actinosynnema pretiosum subsp. pretiosum]